MVDSVKISDREELIYLLSEAAEKEAKSVAHSRMASATLCGGTVALWPTTSAMLGLTERKGVPGGGMKLWAATRGRGRRESRAPPDGWR